MHGSDLFGNPQAVGHLLFRSYLLPFEVTSILILIAIMGAVVLARREQLMVPISYYLVLSAILFACGVAGFLIKRNIITIFLSIELMLNGVNLTFVAFAAQLKSLDGHIFVFFVMVVAAAEAAVGLAIIIAVFRTRETLNVDRVNLLKL